MDNIKISNACKMENRPIIRPQKSTMFDTSLIKYGNQPFKISEKVAQNFKAIGIKSDANLKQIDTSKYSGGGDGDGMDKASMALRTPCRSSSGYTKILTQNKTYDWIVENIRSFRPSLSDSNKSNGFIDIRSPTFSLVSENAVTHWHIFIRFGENKNGQQSDHASIWLVLDSYTTKQSNEPTCSTDEPDNLKACFEVRIMSDFGKVEQVLKSGYRVFTVGQVEQDIKATWGFSQFIPYSEFDCQSSKLFTGDKLRITLELKIFQGSVNFPFPQRRLNDADAHLPKDMHNDCRELQACRSSGSDHGGSGDHCGLSMKSRSDMTQAISTLWKNDRFADVQIIVRDKCFLAHKAILTARSRVFDKMLSSDNFSENQDSTVNLDTLSPTVVENMLQFIYTDAATIPHSTDEIAELLEAAEMYELFPLKYDCYFELINRLDISNVSKIAVISYYYRPTEDIKAVIKEYLHNNLTEVIETKTFEDTFRKFKQAFAEILSPDAYRSVSSLEQS